MSLDFIMCVMWSQSYWSKSFRFWHNFFNNREHISYAWILLINPVFLCILTIYKFLPNPHPIPKFLILFYQSRLCFQSLKSIKPYNKWRQKSLSNHIWGLYDRVNMGPEQVEGRMHCLSLSPKWIIHQSG